MQKNWLRNRGLQAMILLIFLATFGACTESSTNHQGDHETDISDATDPDVGEQPDGGGQQDVENGSDVPEGYRLRGQLVPSGGFSMGDTYTLSGTLSAGPEPVELQGESYRLTTAP